MDREGRHLETLIEVREHTSLQLLIAELIDANEPEALLAALQRISEHMARRAAKLNAADACQRWTRLRDVIGHLRVSMS